MARDHLPVTDAQSTSNTFWHDRLQDLALDQNVEHAVKELGEQASVLRLLSFDADDAHQLGEAILSLIKAYYAGKSALISIRLWNGLTLYQNTYGPKVAPTNEDWARRKANTVRVYNKSSFLVGRELVKKGRAIDSLGPEFAAHGGAFPIFVKGVQTGSIGAAIVSGLDQWEDHHAVAQGIATLLQAQKDRGGK